MPTIAKSVGIGGQNNKADVRLVQAWLNNFIAGLGLPALVVDGGYGDKTGTAIRRFQSRIVGLANPDGRVDPGGRTLRLLSGSPPPGPTNDPALRSGGAWWHANQAKFANSEKIEDLTPEFAGNLRRFIAAMRAGGATVRISSTTRNKVRAYLMHYSWRLAAGDIAARDIPPEPGCQIVWDHGNTLASRQAAQAMSTLFNIVYQPSLRSRHIEGKAVDMTISWSGILRMKNGSGSTVDVPPPGSGDINAKLHQVGATFGVVKLVSDKPHWSTDGH